jgi:hypothetical protein
VNVGYLTAVSCRKVSISIGDDLIGIAITRKISGEDLVDGLNLKTHLPLEVGADY